MNSELNPKSLTTFLTFLRRNWRYAIKNPDWISDLRQWWPTVSKNSFLLAQDPPVPWITIKARRWLDRHLNKEMKVFEYGSGASTLYYSKAAGHVTTVEHDTEWYAVVKKTLESAKRSNVNLTLIEPTKGESTFEYSINSYSSNFQPTQYAGFCFRNYVRHIDSFPDNYFDLVVVDGRSRISCISHALPKIKSGGYLMLDNSERKEYEVGLRLLANFPVQHYYGLGPCSPNPWRTSLWRISNPE